MTDTEYSSSDKSNFSFHVEADILNLLFFLIFFYVFEKETHLSLLFKFIYL